MPTSYNGWPASRDPSAINIKPFAVAGRDFPGGVKGGAVATVLKYVAAQMHVRVESLYYGDTDRDDWGYSYRPNVNNPSELSCHSSGTAIDINATNHPNGKPNTFTYAQVKTIQAIMKECSGLVRWGGTFTTRDEMHFEIHGNSTQIAALAKRLLNPDWWYREIKLGMYGQDVRVVQSRMHTKVTGKLNATDIEALSRFRAKLHLPKGTTVPKSLAYYIGRPA